MAIKAGNFKILLRILSDLQLVDALTNAKAQTIFAPSDEAFAKLPKGFLQNLTSTQKMAIVSRHVVTNTTLLVANVTTGLKCDIKTAGGESICLFKTSQDGVEIYYTNNPLKSYHIVTVVTADVKASNGVIHVIDKVIF